jgi:putative SOS response-associated peptidase YedK
MCGRYLLTSPIEALRRAFGVDDPPRNLAPRWNIAPTQECLAVRQDEQGRRHFASLRWGLVPAWAKDASGAARMINARGETVAEKPAYREALRKRRCLVPADGFYEWPEQGDRRPVLIRRADAAPFAFAGLWESWRDPAGGVRETFTIVNTAAIGAMAKIHPRVPIVLAADDHDSWLDPDRDPSTLIKAPPSSWFTWIRVSTHVNAVRNDDAACVAPADDAPPAAAAAPATPPRRGDKRQASLF